MDFELKVGKTPLMRFSRVLARISLIHGTIKRLEEHQVDTIGRRERYLLESYIIYLVSAWQAFNQSIAAECFESLKSRGKISDTSPGSIENRIRNFSTPNFQNINELILIATEKRDIAREWRWEDVDPDDAKKALKELLKVRHCIAHEGFSRQELSVSTNYRYMKYLFNMGTTMNNILGEHVSERIGKSLYQHAPIRYKIT